LWRFLHTSISHTWFFSLAIYGSLLVTLDAFHHQLVECHIFAFGFFVHHQKVLGNFFLYFTALLSETLNTPQNKPFFWKSTNPQQCTS